MKVENQDLNAPTFEGTVLRWILYDSSEFHQQDWGPPIHSGNQLTLLLAFLSFLSCSPHSLSSASWDSLPPKNYLHSSPVSAPFLGEHKLRHWSKRSTSRPLKGRCFYLLIYVFIPSFQENSRLRVVKESSQIHKTVSDIVVLGGYQLIGQFSIMESPSWKDSQNYLMWCSHTIITFPRVFVDFFFLITAPMKYQSFMVYSFMRCARACVCERVRLAILLEIVDIFFPFQHLK